jgi:hypothetical protein
MNKKELEEAKKTNAEVQGRKLGSQGPHRLWSPVVDSCSSAVQTEATHADWLKEAQLERKRLDRLERLAHDPNGTGIWAFETMEELVRRQNER